MGRAFGLRHAFDAPEPPAPPAPADRRLVLRALACFRPYRALTLLAVAGTLTVLFVVSWPLALAACLTLPVFLVPARRAGRWRRQLVAQTQARQAELLALLQDVLNVGGFLLMRLFGRTNYEAERF